MFDGIRRALARRRDARARKQDLTMKFSPGAPTVGQNPHPLPTGLVVRDEMPPPYCPPARRRAVTDEEIQRIAREGRARGIAVPDPYPIVGQYPSLTALDRAASQRWYPAPEGYEQTGPERFYVQGPSCGQQASEPVAADPAPQVVQGPDHWHRAIDPAQGGSWGAPSPSDTGYSSGSSSYDSGSSSSYDSGSSGGSSDSGSSSSSCD